MDTIEDRQVLEFPEGIAGFSDARRFVLEDLDEHGTFQVLQCLDDPEVSLVVCVPWLLFPDYQADLSDDEQERLALERAEDAVVFCGVTVDSQERAFHVNLLGPFVVNSRTRQGRQVVLAESGHEARATVRLDALGS